MSLVYREDDRSSRGKTSQRTDTFRGRFVKLIPYQRIVWATEFESADTSFASEMIVDNTRPEDNEAGCRSTLEKLASFLDG